MLLKEFQYKYARAMENIQRIEWNLKCLIAEINHVRNITSQCQAWNIAHESKETLGSLIRKLKKLDLKFEYFNKNFYQEMKQFKKQRDYLVHLIFRFVFYDKEKNLYEGRNKSQIKKIISKIEYTKFGVMQKYKYVYEQGEYKKVCAKLDKILKRSEFFRNETNKKYCEPLKKEYLNNKCKL